MSLIAIGDIHGCVNTLKALLERLAPSTDDHLIFIGDYIDRGPDSMGVIEYLLALRESYPCTFLRGNHEALMLGYLDEGIFDLWRMNGGVATLNSYAKANLQSGIPQAHIDFVRTTEMYLDTPDFFFVHAGLRAQYTIEENLARFGEDIFLWERGHLNAETFAWEKPVVCGHTPQQVPLNQDLLMCIDTGCVYHRHPFLGHLAAVRLPERDFVLIDYMG